MSSYFLWTFPALEKKQSLQKVRTLFFFSQHFPPCLGLRPNQIPPKCWGWGNLFAILFFFIYILDGLLFLYLVYIFPICISCFSSFLYFLFPVFIIFSTPRQSQGLLYKHLRHWFIHWFSLSSFVKISLQHHAQTCRNVVNLETRFTGYRQHVGL